MIEIPYTKGSKKAKSAMVKRYGKKKGTRIFYARAMKLGKGRSAHARANSIYTKGRRLRKRRR